MAEMLPKDETGKEVGGSLEAGRRGVTRSVPSEHS